MITLNRNVVHDHKSILMEKIRYIDYIKTKKQEKSKLASLYLNITNNEEYILI